MNDHFEENNLKLRLLFLNVLLTNGYESEEQERLLADRENTIAIMKEKGYDIHLGMK